MGALGQELPVAGPAELPFNRGLNFKSCHTADTNSSANPSIDPVLTNGCKPDFNRPELRLPSRCHQHCWTY